MESEESLRIQIEELKVKNYLLRLEIECLEVDLDSLRVDLDSKDMDLMKYRWRCGEVTGDDVSHYLKELRDKYTEREEN